ncbi:MAG: TlyA family rRNA (cytidine-2'-O)-methyltransferase, partial [Clostridia bacterium]|nr:TlyA family rRNA (cytidine-2'-O)-methyltransferase [Clostridia bacterium]
MRLDSYLVQEGYFSTRTKAKQAVERGEIYIDSKQVLKSSFDVSLG